jgi:acyl carrier protein
MTTPGASGDVASVRAWLLSYLSNRLGIEEIYVDLRRGLGEYGLDSVDAVIMIGELEEHVGTEIDPKLIFEFDTLEEMLSAWDRIRRAD